MDNGHLIDGVDASHFSYDWAGEPMLQLSVGMDLYFGRPMDAFRDQLHAVWQRYEEIYGHRRFRWARLGGGNKSRIMNEAGYRTIDSWLDGSRSYGLHCFINAHDGQWEQIGRHAFIVSGNNRPQNGTDDTDVNYVQIRLPLTVLRSPEKLARDLCEIASPLQYHCGTAGLMLQASPFSRDRLWPEMKAIVTRFEGIEPDMAERCICTAALGLSGINWLTFVGPPSIGELGGHEALKAKADHSQSVTLRGMNGAVVLQAGVRPHLGDRDQRSADLDPYRSVYALLKPALVFDRDYAFSEDAFDGDAVVTWRKRFEPAAR